VAFAGGGCRFRDAGTGRLSLPGFLDCKGLWYGRDQRGNDRWRRRSWQRIRLRASLVRFSAFNLIGTATPAWKRRVPRDTRDASGDRVDAHLRLVQKGRGRGNGGAGIGVARIQRGGQIQSAVLDGHVVLTQERQPRPARRPMLRCGRRRDMQCMRARGVAASDGEPEGRGRRIATDGG